MTTLETTTLSRRAALTGASALAAGAAANIAAVVVAKSAETDPVFAAIEGYRRAYAFFGENLDKVGIIQTAVFERQRAGLEAEADKEQEMERLEAEGSAVEQQALEALLGVVPTTTVGASAKLTFILGEAHAEPSPPMLDYLSQSDCVVPLLQSLAEFLSDGARA